MCVVFDRAYDDIVPFGGTKIATATAAQQLLDRLLARGGPPYFVELQRASGEFLLLGLGPACVVQFTSAGDESKNYMIRGSGSLGEYIEFLMGDTPTPIPARYGIVPSTLRQAVTAFIETGRCDPNMDWEEI